MPRLTSDPVDAFYWKCSRCGVDSHHCDDRPCDDGCGGWLCEGCVGDLAHDISEFEN